MYRFKQISLILLSGAFVVFSTMASAGIYKCTNKKTGKIQYLDKPCSVDLSEKKIKAVKDPKGGFIPAPFKEVSKASSEKGQSKKGKDEVESSQEKQAKIDEKYKDYRLDISDKQKKLMYEAEQAMQERDKQEQLQMISNDQDLSSDEKMQLRKELGLNDNTQVASDEEGNQS